MLFQANEAGVTVTDMIGEDYIGDLLRPPTAQTEQIRVVYDEGLDNRLNEALLAGGVRARLTLHTEGPTETISLGVKRVYRDGDWLVLDHLPS